MISTDYDIGFATFRQKELCHVIELAAILRDHPTAEKNQAILEAEKLWTSATFGRPWNDLYPKGHLRCRLSLMLFLYWDLFGDLLWTGNTLETLTNTRAWTPFFFSFSKIFDIRPLANAIADGWSWDCLPVSVVVFMHSWSWHWPTMVLFNQPYTSFSQQLHTVMQQLPLYASFLSHKKIRSSTTPESLYYYHYLWNQSFKPSWISTKADFDIHRSRCPASTSWEPLACGEIWQQSAELAFREFSPNIGVSQEPQVEGQIRLFCMWI